MCPLCAATVVATIAGSSSAGGVAALVVRKLHPSTQAPKITDPLQENIMNKQDMTFTLTVEQTPEQVSAAIADVAAWWPGKFTGETDKLGAEFTYQYRDMHRSTQKVTEWVPGRRVVWHVTDSHLSFLERKDEWTGTDMVFDIARKGGKTVLTFTHVGLTPGVECYEACTEGWGFCIEKSLYKLITTGKGMLDFEDAA